ncbi:hypothetical protein AVEN_152637-1, partial [Araneus ventricosus]
VETGGECVAESNQEDSDLDSTTMLLDSRRVYTRHYCKPACLTLKDLLADAEDVPPRISLSLSRLLFLSCLHPVPSVIDVLFTPVFFESMGLP